METTCRQIVYRVSNYVDQMGPEEWVWVLAAVIIVGGLCLRGFGSRSGM